MFAHLEEINARPAPFQCYTAGELWTHEHTSMKMLEYHLDESVDLASRNRGFIDRSIRWIVSHFGVNTNTRIADFGCGPGLYTTPLAENHAQVTGIDFSERSLQHARRVAEQKKLTIDYIQQNYLEFETDKRFDLIVMIFCDFCTLSPGQRETLLGRFYRFLNPGGAVLLDVYSMSAFDKKEETATCKVNQLNGFWSPEKYYGFLNTFKYEEEKVTLDKYTIVEAGRTRTIYNWYQFFTPKDLEKEFKTAGFSVEEFYSDVAGTPCDPGSAEFAVVARKE